MNDIVDTGISELDDRLIQSYEMTKQKFRDLREILIENGLSYLRRTKKHHESTLSQFNGFLSDLIGQSKELSGEKLTWFLRSWK